MFNDGVIGFGGVVRDGKGGVLLAVSDYENRAIVHEVVEAMTLRYALRIACELWLWR